MDEKEISKNIDYIIKKFKKGVNADYKLNANDLNRLKDYVSKKIYFSNYSEDNQFIDFDYDVLKENKVSDFSFIENYKTMCREKLEVLLETKRIRGH